MTVRPNPWEVWWVDFNPQVGSEQAGLRPAIVVGTRFACTLPSRLVVVVPCTTSDRGLPFHPAVNLAERPGFAMCDQLKTISTDRLRNRHKGTVTDDEIIAIRTALRRIIDL